MFTKRNLYIPLILLSIREKMIQVAETLIKYGYLAIDLPLQSYKPILAACDNCGTVRIVSKNSYRALCLSCCKKGKHFTEEHKALIGKNQPDKNGKKNPNYKGGMKFSKAKTNARRKRGLGYIPLNTPFEGCEGHHITHNYVIYISTALHRSIYHNLNTGQNMELINALVLDFLVKGV